MSRFSFIRRAVVALTAFAALGAAHAETREVVIAYQDMVVPWRYAQASGEVEKATGYKVTFRKLDSGADVIRALASGSVQLGEAGSSPIAAGLSQGLDISLFWVLDNINDAEALVARNGSGVTNIASLKGKKIGVPFVSTSHFHTLVALQAAGVNPNDVKIDRQPASARSRGGVGTRGHRRDLHLGSGAREGQAVGHRVDDVGPGCERKWQGDLRRLRREPQVRA